MNHQTANTATLDAKLAPGSSLSKSFNRYLRRIVPSTAKLSYNTAFKLVVNAADLLPRAIWPEFRKLPPNHLRIRVGVGNRLFTNQVNYLTQFESLWLAFIEAGYIDLSSSIVDIGSGCGRAAHHLRDFRYYGGSRFEGQYIGVDIDEEMLKWCSDHFDAERFRFARSTHASKSYNQAGSNDRYTLPVDDSSVNFVFSTSLFTHLLEGELINYCEEAFRILKPGGRMFMYSFCLDHPLPTFGGRHTFSHKIGNASVESLSQPEAAVAYTEEFLISAATRTGFKNAQILAEKGGWWQPVLIGER